MNKNIKYKKILEILIERIEAGYYDDMQSFPTTEVIAKEFSASILTVKKVYKILINDGYIYSRSGYGTKLIKKEKSDKEQIFLRRVRGFSKDIGKEKSRIKVIKFEIITADDFVAEKLNIDQGSKCFHFIRIRNILTMPVVYEEGYCPAEMLTLSKNDCENSIYEAINKIYEITNLNKKISTDKVNNLIAKSLNIEINTYLLRMDDITMIKNRTPILYSKNYFINDYFELIINDVK